MNSLWDKNPALRSSGEWRDLLTQLVSSLSSFLGVEFHPTSWFIHDDRAGFASSCNCVDITATLHEGLGLVVNGVIGISINFGEAVWVSSDLLLFGAQRRLRGAHGTDFISLAYTASGWNSSGWVMDDTGEWESHDDDSRWATCGYFASE